MKIYFITFFLLTGLTATLNGQPPPVSSLPVSDPNGPVLTFETDTIDFGTIPEGTEVERTFQFKNTGKSPLVISNATAPCGCTVPSFPREPVAPGKTGVITVKFNSAGRIGYQHKQITITSNNRDGAEYIFLIGNVTDAPAPK
ncbi:MAG TPA: DUF1573 domain-containing protein [Bacteroidia bacterium]|nr:DUF1573 domain-containing protein [Bacteroidia bacterium]